MVPCIPDSVEKGSAAEEVVLYGFRAMNDTVGSMSPYVGKVETFMRMNDIPYRGEVLMGGAEKSPKKMVRAAGSRPRAGWPLGYSANCRQLAFQTEGAGMYCRQAGVQAT